MIVYLVLVLCNVQNHLVGKEKDFTRPSRLAHPFVSPKKTPVCLFVPLHALSALSFFPTLSSLYRLL